MDTFTTVRLPYLADPTESQPRQLSATRSKVVSEADVSDEDLVLQVCTGSADAMACLFRRYARLVRAISYRVLRDASEADDLVQDIFLLINRDCRQFDRSKGPARSWILQMAYRRAISRRRYLNSRHFYTRIDLEEAGSELADSRQSSRNSVDWMDGKIENAHLQRIFGSLSDIQQQTLRLFFVDGYTLEEIAAKLGQSRGNVKHHYFRGLERLRKQLFGSERLSKRA